MSQRLAEALRDAAADVPPYDVLDRAIARGRRRRRSAALGSAAAILVLVALVGAALGAVLQPPPPPPAEPQPSQASLPEHIGVPGRFIDTVVDSPPGPAGLLFTHVGTASPRFVTVGAADDTYRQVYSASEQPGRLSFLSPTGDRVARPGIEVDDLRTGRTRRYPVPGDSQSPVAWLPDGRGLVVLTISTGDDGVYTKRLSVLDLDTGVVDQFAEATWPVAPPGFVAAVSTDGRRIAYQFSDFVTVYDRATRAKTVFTLPDASSVLAGKGAWTPDGQSLAIMHRAPARFGDRGFELMLVDPATGQERDPGHRPAMGGIAVMLLVGWDGRTGNPVVVAYYSDFTADTGFQQGLDEVPAGSATSVGVYELAPDEVRVRVEAVDGILTIDVAEAVLAGGRSRPGAGPPWTLPVPSWLAVAAGVLLLALALIVAVPIALRRRGALH